MLRSADQAKDRPAETWERLSTLATRNGIPIRTIYSFIRDGLKVARPAGGRAIYSRQVWLDEYLESKVQP